MSAETEHQIATIRERMGPGVNNEMLLMSIAEIEARERGADTVEAGKAVYVVDGVKVGPDGKAVKDNEEE